MTKKLRDFDRMFTRAQAQKELHLSLSITKLAAQNQLIYAKKLSKTKRTQECEYNRLQSMIDKSVTTEKKRTKSRE